MLGTDWGEWSLNNEGELDTVMQEDYRRADDDDGDEDEDAETKDDNQTFGVCFLPQFHITRCKDNSPSIFPFFSIYGEAWV